MRTILFAGLVLSLAGIVQAEERILEWAPIELPSDQRGVSVGAMSVIPFISRDPSKTATEESTFKTRDEFSEGYSLNIRKRPREELLRQKQRELKKLQKEVEDLNVEVNWQQQLVITVRCLEVENSKIRTANTPLNADPNALQQKARRYHTGRGSFGSMITAKTLRELEQFLAQSHASELLNEQRTLQSGATASFSVGAIAENSAFIPWYLRGWQTESPESAPKTDDVPVGYSLRVEPKKLLLGEILLDFESPISNRDPHNSVKGIECCNYWSWEPHWIETSHALLVSGLPSGSTETQVIWVVKFQLMVPRSATCDSVAAEMILEGSIEQLSLMREARKEPISWGPIGVTR